MSLEKRVSERYVLAHVVHKVEPELVHLVQYGIEPIRVIGEGIGAGDWVNDVETAYTTNEVKVSMGRKYEKAPA